MSAYPPEGGQNTCFVVLASFLLFSYFKEENDEKIQKTVEIIFTLPGKLWISYFDEGATVPPPFNMVPTPKAALKILLCKKKSATRATEEEKKAAETRYFG